jgi:tripartite-type tricarboxylate transporter receptor subunit TctC
MLITRRRFGSLFPAAAVVASAPARPAAGQPLKLIVGFAPGGTADVVARALAEGMRGSGINVVVDNRPGASGRIGTEAFMMASADGDTLLMTPSTNLTLFPHIYSNLRYKLGNLAIIGAPANVEFGLAVNSQDGPKTLTEFLDRAKRDSTSASYGTPGAGSVMQLLGDLLAKHAKVPLVSVPYKGGAAALNDVIGGSLGAALTALPNLLPMHKNGKLRILAVTSEERLAALPEVPTFKSIGFPQLTASEYMCVVAKREVPAPVLAHLEAAVAAAAKAPATVAVMERLGFQPSPVVDQAVLARKLASDSARWQVAVRETGFKAAE